LLKIKKSSFAQIERSELNGFALVYVMLFTMMALVVVTIIAGALVSNIKLQRSSVASIQINSLAKVGIDEGLSQYKDVLDNKVSENVYIDYGSALTTAYTTSLKTAKPGTILNCGSTITYNIFIANAWQNDKTLAQIKTLVSANPTDPSIYAYRVCYDNATNKKIEAIGYYKGFRTSMTSTYTHVLPTGLTGADATVEKYKATYHYTTPNPIIGQPDIPHDGDCGTDTTVTGLTSCPLQGCTEVSNCTLKDILFNHSSDTISTVQTNL